MPIGFILLCCATGFVASLPLSASNIYAAHKTFKGELQTSLIIAMSAILAQGIYIALTAITLVYGKAAIKFLYAHIHDGITLYQGHQRPFILFFIFILLGSALFFLKKARTHQSPPLTKKAPANKMHTFSKGFALSMCGVDYLFSHAAFLAYYGKVSLTPAEGIIFLLVAPLGATLCWALKITFFYFCPKGFIKPISKLNIHKILATVCIASALILVPFFLVPT